MDTIETQNFLLKLLDEKFGPQVTIKEWDVAKDSLDGYNRELYCPRLDIAVGPFNIDGNVSRNLNSIKREADSKTEFLNLLLSKSISSTENFEYNKNPRCFLAIEIEKSGSRKHMLGDIANSSILGYMGIVIPLGEKKPNQFKKIKDYIDFAVRNEKTSKVFNNVIIIKLQDFLDCLAILN